MQMSPTESRERVKGGTPLQRQSLWGHMMSAEGVYILSAKTCFGGITMEKETLIVVGLGNPGTQYAAITRGSIRWKCSAASGA